MRDNVCPRNNISYFLRDTGSHKLLLFVSGTELDRTMSVLVKGTEDATTITFPNTVREVRRGAFSGEVRKPRVLKSVVLNEGLERLGECNDRDLSYQNGVFCCSQL